MFPFVIFSCTNGFRFSEGTGIKIWTYPIYELNRKTQDVTVTLSAYPIFGFLASRKTVTFSQSRYF